MDDKELVEVWRKEHKSLLLATNNWCLANFQEVDGAYYDWHLQASWQGFLVAKLSQPAITVPAYDMHHYAPVRNLMAKMDSAGIKYTIGE